MTAVYRTVIEVEVFTEGPLSPSLDLAEVAELIRFGPGIGDVGWLSQEAVPPGDVAGHLRRIGNDGTFFDLDDDERNAR